MDQQRKSSADNAFIAKYIGEQNQSSDEEPEIEVFESPDYDPFVAKFRKINPGLSVEDRGNILTRGLINLRANPHMLNIMQKMFDYDLEESDIEELFINKEKLEPIFDFIDVTFQLLDGPFDKAVALLNKKCQNSGNITMKKAL